MPCCIARSAAARTMPAGVASNWPRAGRWRTPRRSDVRLFPRSSRDPQSDRVGRYDHNSQAEKPSSAGRPLGALQPACLLRPPGNHEHHHGPTAPAPAEADRVTWSPPVGSLVGPARTVARWPRHRADSCCTAPPGKPVLPLPAEALSALRARSPVNSALIPDHWSSKTLQSTEGEGNSGQPKPACQAQPLQSRGPDQATPGSQQPPPPGAPAPARPVRCG